MEKRENTPQVRFEGYTNTWEQRKFEDIFETITDYVAAGSFATIAENVKYLSEPSFAQLIRTTDLKSGFSQKDEVFVDKQAFEFLHRVNLNKESVVMPNVGNCGEIYYTYPELFPNKNNVLGPNAILVRSESNNNHFLADMMKAPNFQEKLKLLISPSGQTKFNKTQLKQISIQIPTIQEQQLLGTFFQQIDSAITLYQRKYEKLQLIKTALFGLMYPQKGYDTPQVRFEGYTNTWEQRKFGDFYTNIESGNRIPKSQFKPGNIPLIMASSQNNGIGAFIDPATPDYNGNALKIFKANSITFSIDNPEAIHLQKSNFCTSNIIRVMYRSCSISESFFFLESLKMKTSGYDWSHKFSGPVVADLKLFVPIVEEREKVGAFFQQLDDTITLHQRKYEKLQLIKTALLGMMFPTD